VPRLEGDHVFLRHEDLFAGPRVACPTWSPSLHLEDAEIAEFDPPLVNQGIQDGLEDLLDDLLGFSLGEAEVPGDSVLVQREMETGGS
jgi:hypothetical protein